MHKLVYLFELDSVRNSAKEIEKGQQALYEEILGRGNYVALTFNQLTDSHAFLSLIDDKKSYECILKLFESGSLRVSRYGDFRTASAYVQSAIKKCLNSGEEIFQFSAVPGLSGKPYMLRTMQKALQNSDPSVLEDELSKKRNDGTTPENKLAQLEYLIRYIRLILFLSVQSITAIPAKNEPKAKLSQFIERVINLYDPQQNSSALQGFLSQKIRRILSQAAVQLQQIKQILLEKDGTNLIENRTNWVNILNGYPGDTTIYMAEAIVDLCYNYTLEDSIQGAAKHYHDPAIPFQTDFEHRLALYWDDFNAGIHTFHKGDSCHVQQMDKLRLPPWDIAVRLINFERKHLGR